MKKSNSYFNMVLSLMILLLVGLMLYNALFNNNEDISYNEVVTYMEDSKVQSITLEPSVGTYNLDAVLEDGTNASAVIPKTDGVINQLTEISDENDIELNLQPTQDSSFIYTLIFLGINIVIIFFLFKFITKQMNSDNGPESQINNKELNIIKDSKITFDDVIGYEEEKRELTELIEYLKAPQKYIEAGAKMPKGILLEGPPGTGKTLMAKGIAGEASIPFVAMSGSDFSEMFAGLGASKVRNLFEEAKKFPQAIIFIDEIDAIGSRQSKMGGSSSSEQTINQLLTELDGFGTKDQQLIVIAATNKADMLDEALKRPGRFDRKILIDLPNIQDRENILKYHAKKRKIEDNINFAEIARLTIGMSGADLEAIVNEGAILAVRANRKQINKEDLLESIDRVSMGPAKISNKYNDKDKRYVSFHEAGHAIIGLELENASQVEKITIVPRRHANGYVSYTPNEEKNKFTSKEDMLDEITGFLGGRTSEELFLGDITTGAENDLENATKIARSLVTEYAMTDVSLTQLEPINYKQNRAHRYFSEETNQKIDSKVAEILNECHQKAKEILSRRKDDVEKLAIAIQEKETMTRKDILELFSENEVENV